MRSAFGLGEPGQLPRLATEPSGYRLLLAPDDLDLSVFDDLSARGRHALDRGDPAQAARLLSDALALWRDDPGRDVTLDGGSTAILAALAERRVMAEEAWTDAQLLLGSGPDLIGRLRTLVADRPLQERGCGQLMLALYRAGRKAEALDEFRALRRRMTDELGVEPSTPTRDLHQRILADDPALTPTHALKVIPRQLPGDIRDFTGRDGVLRAMQGLLPGTGTAAPAIIAITGMAGAGKTALAVHFAHLEANRFPDGQLFVDLRGHAEVEPKPSAEALRGLLHALDVREIPGDDEEAAALYRSLLARKRMIVLLDNAASALQVRPLLPGSPGSLVLITSRSRLPGLLARNGAAPVTVGPLTGSEGAVLLRKILGAARVQTDPEAVAAIVGHCARLPLALRIAAERAAGRPWLPLAALASELAAEQRRLDALTIGEDAGTSVRSVFSWSYHKLAPDAARMFRLLGLHPGPAIGAQAAAALAGSSLRDAVRQLGLLADAHLLRETTSDSYQFHDLLRTYAAERAAADDPPAARTAALQRVLDRCGQTADAAATTLVSTHSHVPPHERSAGPLTFAGYDDALPWCDAEYANLMAAVDDARDCLHRALPIRTETGEWREEGATPNNAGAAHGDQGRFEDSNRYSHSALGLAIEIGDQRSESAARLNIGEAHQGLAQDKVVCCLQALRIARESDDAGVAGCVLNSLSKAFRALGWSAVTHDHLQAWHCAGASKNEAESRCELGDLLSGIREAQAAQEHWRATQAIVEELSDHRTRELRRRLEVRRRSVLTEGNAWANEA